MSDDLADARRALTSRLVRGDGLRTLRGNGTPLATFAAATSKSWRRTALSEYSARDTLSKIEWAWSLAEPLVFTVPCGGYKSWRVPSSPMPNWAEVFFVDYLRRFVRDVSAVYPFGVRAELTYVSGVMDLVSNHDPSWQPAYVSAVQGLLAYHSDEPDQLVFVDIAAEPGVGDVRAAVLNNFAQMRSEWDGNRSDAQLARLRSASRNFAPDGVKRVEAGALEERILESAILCDALDALEARRRYNKFGPRIQLVFDRRPQPAIHIGTCETSTTHFWVSTGVLQLHRERYLPRMLGHTTDAVQTRARVHLDQIDEYRALVGDWLPDRCEVI